MVTGGLVYSGGKRFEWVGLSGGGLYTLEICSAVDQCLYMMRLPLLQLKREMKVTMNAK
jgi:hypothetical protein